MLPALSPEAADFLARYLAAGEDLHAVLNLADPATPAASLLTALDFLNHPDITPWLAAYRATLAHARRHAALDALARSLPTTTDPTQLRLTAATILHFTRPGPPPRAAASAAPTLHTHATVRPPTGQAAASLADEVFDVQTTQAPRPHQEPAPMVGRLSEPDPLPPPQDSSTQESSPGPHGPAAPRPTPDLSTAPPDSSARADRARDPSPDNPADITLPDTDILPAAFASDPDPLTQFTLLRRRDLLALAGQARAVPDG